MQHTETVAVTTRDEDELLLQIAEGDRAAFSVLYDRMIGRIFGLVRRTLVDVDQTEEVTQEVFLYVWQNASRFDPARGRAAAWICTTAHRRAVDRVRASQSSRTRDLETGVREYRPDFDSTYETVEVRMEHERVQDALNRISSAQRETVLLSYHHGRSNLEIAELLRLPISTVKTRLRDGLIRLRRELSAAPAR